MPHSAKVTAGKRHTQLQLSWVSISPLPLSFLALMSFLFKKKKKKLESCREPAGEEFYSSDLEGTSRNSSGETMKKWAAASSSVPR